MHVFSNNVDKRTHLNGGERFPVRFSRRVWMCSVHYLKHMMLAWIVFELESPESSQIAILGPDNSMLSI